MQGEIPEDLKARYKTLTAWKNEPATWKTASPVLKELIEDGIRLIERIAPLTIQLREQFDAASKFADAIVRLTDEKSSLQQALTYSQQRNAEFIEQVGAMTTAMDRLKVELGEQKEMHNQHWLDRESGQVECECCCGHALDYDRWRKEKQALEGEVEILKARIGELNPAEIPTTRPSSLAVNQLYYHQKDGGCKHDSRCGKICYNCVDELAQKYYEDLKHAEEMYIAMQHRRR